MATFIRSLAGMFTMTKTDRLSAVEQAELSRCVDIVKRGIQAWDLAGEALLTIRDQRLYRATHDSFQAFGEATFNLSRRRLDQLIESFQILRGLKTEKLVSQSVPESVVRPLAGLSPADQIAVWSEASGGDGVPSASQVRTAAASRRPTRRAKKRTVKPIRVKVPGGTVVVVPGKAYSDPETLLTAALEKLRLLNASKAA